MRKLSTRVGAAVALVAGASVLSTGTSLAAVPQLPSPSTEKGAASALDGLGGLTGGLSKLTGGIGGKQAALPDAQAAYVDPVDDVSTPGDDNSTGNPNPGPLPPIPKPTPEPTPKPDTRPGSGNHETSGSKANPAFTPSASATAAEAGGLPFCPPVKDINLGIEGMHNHLVIPFIGGAIEGVPDIVNDMSGICLNLDYPSDLLSPGNEIPAELFSAGGTDGAASGRGESNGNASGGGLAAGLL